MKKKLHYCTKPQKGRRGKYCLYTILFLVLNICLKMFIVEIFHITGFSMYPTLKNGDYLILCKCCSGIRLPRNIFEIPWVGTVLYYCLPSNIIDKELSFSQNKLFVRIGNFNPIKRGEIIAFNNPQKMNSFCIKRCVALPGDSITNTLFADSISIWNMPFKVVPYRGMKIAIDSLSVKEMQIVKNNRVFRYSSEERKFVAQCNTYFVLGDNNLASEDSRNWGPISEDLIIGKLMLIIHK